MLCYILYLMVDFIYKPLLVEELNNNKKGGKMVIKKEVNELPTLKLGKFIAEKRENLGLSQRKMAKIIGKSNHWLNKLERGILQTPKADDVKKLAKLLQTTPTLIWIKAGYIESGINEKVDLELLADLSELEKEKQNKVRSFIREYL